MLIGDHGHDSDPLDRHLLHTSSGDTAAGARSQRKAQAAAVANYAGRSNDSSAGSTTIGDSSFALSRQALNFLAMLVAANCTASILVMTLLEHKLYGELARAWTAHLIQSIKPSERAVEHLRRKAEQTVIKGSSGLAKVRVVE
jgi:hypothetical protein